MDDRRRHVNREERWNQSFASFVKFLEQIKPGAGPDARFQRKEQD